MTDRAEHHRYLSYVCAETGQHDEAEYHRLEAQAEQLMQLMDAYSVLHPWFWVLLARSYQLDVRRHAAWLKVQDKYRGLP